MKIMACWLVWLVASIPLHLFAFKNYKLVDEYGADPTGNSNSADNLQSALNAAELDSDNDIRILVPPGNYRMDSRVIFNPTGSNKKISLIGVGMRTVEFVINNDSGFIKVEQLTGVSGLQCHLKRFAVITQRGAGNGIVFTKATRDSGTANFFSIEDVLMQGEAEGDYFSTYLLLRNVGNPSINNLKMVGNSGADQYAGLNGVLLEDCTSPSVALLYVMRMNRGLHIKKIDSGYTPGGGEFLYNWFVNVRNGIFLNFPTLTDTDFRFAHGHINFYDYGIEMLRAQDVTFDNYLMYCHDRSGSTTPGGAGGAARNFTPTDIKLTACNRINISGNIHTEASNPNRTAVSVDRNTLTTDITGSIFNNEGTGVFAETDSVTDVKNCLFGGRAYTWGPQQRYDDPKNKINSSDVN